MKAILIVNLGTPNSYSVKDVRIFLREFLMDPLVVDMPIIARWLLVNLVIVPFRGPKSAKEYKQLWTELGSPLKVHSEQLLEKLISKSKGTYEIELGMRYQNPSIIYALEKLRQKQCDEILVIPLFPQYAEATSLSVIRKVEEDLYEMDWNVPVRFIRSFADNSAFIQAIVSQAAKLGSEIEFDHTLFSYHGIPERQLIKSQAGTSRSSCLTQSCCDQYTNKNEECYRAQCFETSRVLAKQLNLTASQYSVCFQSRQGRIPWTQPYIDDVIKQLAKEGKKDLRVFSPAFVADCLETEIEIGHTYKNLFKSLGGNSLTLVPSLNASDEWVDALHSMISG